MTKDFIAKAARGLHDPRLAGRYEVLVPQTGVARVFGLPQRFDATHVTLGSTE
jgi:hypothetical protein